MVRRINLLAFPAAVRPASLALILVVTVAAACGGGKGGADKAAQTVAGSACISTDTTPITLAVGDFIEKALPTPQRYLSAAGTDSAVPEDGFKLLQNKGPTYFYGGDSVAQRKIREKLASVGPYASLMVLFKGKTETDGGNSVTVKLAGQYIGGEHEGKRAPLKTYTVTCDSTRWKIATSTVEPGS